MAGFSNGALTLDSFPVITSLGENNNVEISGSLIYVIPTNDGDSITGFVPQNDSGILLFVANIDSVKNVILKHDSASSSAGNRIFTSFGSDIIIPPEQTTLLGYDTQNSEWHAIRLAIEPLNVVYFGDQNTDGSWRVRVDAGSLVREKRISGVWTLLGIDSE